MSNTEKTITYPKNLFKGNFKPHAGVKPHHDTVVRGKEKIFWKEYIANNNVDVEIYDTLKKYGCIKEEQLNAHGVAGEFEEFAEMTGAHNKRVELERMFNSLPLETRAMFNHSIDDFADHGAEYVNKIVKDELDKKAAEQAKIEQARRAAQAQAKIDEEEEIARLKRKLGLA